MSERFAAAVWVKPRRRLGFGVVLAAFVVAVALLVSGLSTASNAASPAGKPRAATTAQQQSINAKVNALLGRMTVAEKFGQLEMAGPNGHNRRRHLMRRPGRADRLGARSRPASTTSMRSSRPRSSSRLHIPLIFGLDVIHGYRTMFPVPLGEAATWDPTQVAKDESVSADEAAADGIKWTFNPMVDISPRSPLGPRGGGRRRGSVPRRRRSPPRRCAVIRATTSRPRTRSPRRLSTSEPTAPRSRAANTTRSTCRPSSCSTTICRRTRRRWTPARRPSWPRSTRSTACRTPPTRTCSRRSSAMSGGSAGPRCRDYQAVQELEDFGYASDGADAARLALTAGRQHRDGGRDWTEPRQPGVLDLRAPTVRRCCARARSRWRS